MALFHCRVSAIILLLQDGLPHWREHDILHGLHRHHGGDGPQHRDIHREAGRHLPAHLHRLHDLHQRPHGELRPLSLSELFHFSPLQVSTDIYLRRKKQDKIIGRASAKTDEDGIFGKDDDLHTTVSIVLQETLEEDDKVGG